MSQKSSRVAPKIGIRKSALKLSLKEVCFLIIAVPALLILAVAITIATFEFYRSLYPHPDVIILFPASLALFGIFAQIIVKKLK